MKSHRLFKYISRSLLLTVIITGLYGCFEDPNDWDTDPSHDRLFKPLTFRVLGKADATSVDIIFSNIVEATTYVFEFSEEDSEFENIVKTIELYSDTMKTIYSNSDNIAKVEYLKTFEDLKGSTEYYLRMKGVSPDGRASNYVEATFTTAQEQLFTDHQVQTESATFMWPAGASVTHFELINVATDESMLSTDVLTSQEIANGQKHVEGLSPGIRYRATIYEYEADEDNKRLRGTIDFKTSGIPESWSHTIVPGEDLNEILTEVVGMGYPNITITFQEGETYDMGVIKLPPGINAIALTASTGGSKPIILCENVQVNGAMDQIVLENLDLFGDFEKRLFDTTQEVKEITISGCNMTDYNSIIRLRDSAMEMENVVIDNCIINHLGNYGIFNLGGSKIQLSGLTLSNSTIINFVGTMDIRTQVEALTVENCTFYNDTETATYMFRFDGAMLPYSLVVENNIYSGINADKEISSTYGSYAGLTLSFATSYMTSELYSKVGSRIFTDIEVYAGTAYELFEDPDNLNFSIPLSSGFSGLGVAGDPRWFNR